MRRGRSPRRSDTLVVSKSPQEPRGLLGARRGSLGLAAAAWGSPRQLSRLTTPAEGYCKLVSQYVEFAPKGPPHPSVCVNRGTPLKSFVVPG